MVGGKIVQIYNDKILSPTWVNCMDDNGECCAIFVRNQANLPLDLGDKLWWQNNHAWWTSADGSFAEVDLTKIGCSGVSHPLGIKYQIKTDLSGVVRSLKAKLERSKEACGSI